MKINWLKPLISGLKFSVNPERWLPFFALYLGTFGMFVGIVFLNLEYINLLFKFIFQSENISLIFLLPKLVLIFFEVLIVWIIFIFIDLWIKGSVIHQSYKGKEFKKSWKVSRKKYWSLFGVMVLIGVINFIAGLIPYLNLALSLIISWVFFFPYQEVIIKSSNFYDALRNSLEMFKKKPLEIFIIWFLISITFFIISFIFSLPLLLILGSFLLNQISSALFMVYLPSFIIFGTIALIGFSISRTFFLKAQTEFYLQIKKK